MKLKELIEEKILPKASDKEDKKMRRNLKLAGKKERATMLNRINTVRKSEEMPPFSVIGLEHELKTAGKTPRKLKNILSYRERYDVKGEKPPHAKKGSRYDELKSRDEMFNNMPLKEKQAYNNANEDRRKKGLAHFTNEQWKTYWVKNKKKKVKDYEPPFSSPPHKLKGKVIKATPHFGDRRSEARKWADDIEHGGY